MSNWLDVYNFTRFTRQSRFINLIALFGLIRVTARCLSYKVFSRLIKFTSDWLDVFTRLDSLVNLELLTVTKNLLDWLN